MLFEPITEAFMLSQTSEYALRAVLHLAAYDDAAPVRVGEIAEALGVPQNYLSKVLHVLAREKVLKSLRGPTGGFNLGVPAGELTLRRVVAPFDPDETHMQCLLRRQPCDEDDPCIAHYEWKRIAEQVRDFFNTVTIQELLDEAERHPDRKPADLVSARRESLNK
jgi:Rrf2 family protein